MSGNEVNKALTIAGSDSWRRCWNSEKIKNIPRAWCVWNDGYYSDYCSKYAWCSRVYPVPLEGITEQLNSIGTDLTPDAVKLGMLFSSEIISNRCRTY